MKYSLGVGQEACEGERGKRERERERERRRDHPDGSSPNYRKLRPTCSPLITSWSWEGHVGLSRGWFSFSGHGGPTSL